MYKTGYNIFAGPHPTFSWLPAQAERFVRLPKTDNFAYGIFISRTPDFYRWAANARSDGGLDETTLGTIAYSITTYGWRKDVGLQLATLYDVYIYDGTATRVPVIYEYKLGTKPRVDLLETDYRLKHVNGTIK